MIIQLNMGTKWCTPSIVTRMCNVQENWTRQRHWSVHSFPSLSRDYSVSFGDEIKTTGTQNDPSINPNERLPVLHTDINKRARYSGAHRHDKEQNMPECKRKKKKNSQDRPRGESRKREEERRMVGTRAHAYAAQLHHGGAARGAHIRKLCGVEFVCECVCVGRTHFSQVLKLVGRDSGPKGVGPGCKEGNSARVCIADLFPPTHSSWRI